MSHAEQGRVNTSTGIDPGDFEAVYRAFWPGLVRLALLLTGSRDEAEDLAQDAFVRYRLTASTPLDARAYLRQIVVNQIKDRGRREARRRLKDAKLRQPEALNDHDALIWQLFTKLPDRQRTALVLRFYEDLSVDEVALAMGCPPGTAKSLISRGVGALREELRDDD